MGSGWLEHQSRDPSQHACPAYIASFQDSAELAKCLDPHFDPLDAQGHSQLAAAFDDINQTLPPTCMVMAQGPRLRQKQLSSLVDAAARAKLLANNSRDRYFCAHVALVSAEGAGAWLTALPEDEQRSWSGDEELFRIALRRRCRVVLQTRDCPCPSCGGIMDSYGDHALVCQCRGDRTVRHNQLRDLMCVEAAAAKCCPEREKAGLLPGRPVEDGAIVQDTGLQGDRLRRPADVYLPRGCGGSRRQPAALDWAVTSGLRADKVDHVAAGTADILAEYASYKETYKDTRAKCEEQNIDFLPLIIEAHDGGWGQHLRQTVAFLAAQQKTSGEWCREGPATRMAQRISTALQRANARAILRRCCPPPEDPVPMDLEPQWGAFDAV